MKPDFPGRLSRLRKAISSRGLDGALVNSRRDIFYYTGHEVGPDDPAFYLVTRRKAALFVSTLNNDLEGPGVQVLTDFRPMKEEIRKSGKLGFDDKNTSVMLYKRFRGARLKPFSRELKSVRMVKDSYEVSQLRDAARETLRIFQRLDPNGKTELEVLRDIHVMIRQAGLAPSFEPLILSGKSSAFIHSRPERKRITRGLVITDFGLRKNGYASDLTRMYSINPNPGERQLLEQTREIQEELISMATPGTKFSEIQKRYEKLLKALDCPVLHSFGHGLGLSVHERPGRDDVLREGMVLTVEPGIYKKGLGGSRIEDMVLVSRKPKILSK